MAVLINIISQTILKKKMGPVNVIQYGHGRKQWKPKYDTEREKIINNTL
jgi:hypothetical protein